MLIHGELPLQFWMGKIHTHLVKQETIKASFAALVLPIFEGYACLCTIGHVCFRFASNEDHSSFPLSQALIKTTVLAFNILLSPYHGFLHPWSNYHLHELFDLTPRRPSPSSETQREQNTPPPSIEPVSSLSTPTPHTNENTERQEPSQEEPLIPVSESQPMESPNPPAPSSPQPISTPIEPETPPTHSNSPVITHTAAPQTPIRAPQTPVSVFTPVPLTPRTPQRNAVNESVPSTPGRIIAIRNITSTVATSNPTPSQPSTPPRGQQANPAVSTPITRVTRAFTPSRQSPGIQNRIASLQASQTPIRKSVTVTLIPNDNLTLPVSIRHEPDIQTVSLPIESPDPQQTVEQTSHIETPIRQRTSLPRPRTSISFTPINLAPIFEKQQSDMEKRQSVGTSNSCTPVSSETSENEGFYPTFSPAFFNSDLVYSTDTEIEMVDFTSSLNRSSQEITSSDPEPVVPAQVFIQPSTQRPFYLGDLPPPPSLCATQQTLQPAATSSLLECLFNQMLNEPFKLKVATRKAYVLFGKESKYLSIEKSQQTTISDPEKVKKFIQKHQKDFTTLSASQIGYLKNNLKLLQGKGLGGVETFLSQLNTLQFKLWVEDEYKKGQLENTCRRLIEQTIDKIIEDQGRSSGSQARLMRAAINHDVLQQRIEEHHKYDLCKINQFTAYETYGILSRYLQNLPEQKKADLQSLQQVNSTEGFIAAIKQLNKTDRAFVIDLLSLYWFAWDRIWLKEDRISFGDDYDPRTSATNMLRGSFSIASLLCPPTSTPGELKRDYVVDVLLNYNTYFEELKQSLQA